MAVLTQSNVIPVRNKEEATEVRRILAQKQIVPQSVIDNLKKLPKATMVRKGSEWRKE